MGSYLEHDTKMVWTGYESDSYDIELHAEWTDVTALYTNTTLSAKTNQVTRWEVTDVPLTLTGIHILLVKDAGTSTVAWTYFVNLTGISGALHHASLVRRDILYTSVNTYYSAQSDIELIFGEENVNRWMDVDNTDNVTKRITESTGLIKWPKHILILVFQVDIMRYHLPLLTPDDNIHGCFLSWGIFV